ncbi:MAG: two-component system chemotaxis response regulator CheY [Gammaproteobacteria bacterium]
MHNILLIDDSSDSRRLLKKLITRNYPTIQVEEYDPDLNGVPETSKNWKEYSLVFLDYDLGLENENGLDWLQILITYPDMPPIVILTSETNRSIIVRALKLGASNYLLKADLTADNIISKLAETFEMANLDEPLSNSISLTGGMIDDDAMIDLTATPALENLLAEKTEETLQPDFTGIFESAGDDSLDLDGVSLLIPGYTIQKKSRKEVCLQCF